MKNVQLRGTVTTITPFNVSLPTLKLGELPRNTDNIAYIPATTIRGWLRNGLAFALAEMLQREKNEFLTVDEIYMIASGVDAGRKIKNKGLAAVKVGENNSVRAANPFMSLFGRWQLAGKLSVGSATPSSNRVVKYGMGIRTHSFNRNDALETFVDPNELDYLGEVLKADSLSAEAVKDYKDRKAALETERKTADKERKAEINAEIAEIQELIDESKKERVGPLNSTQHVLNGFEAIDANTECFNTLGLANPSDDELTALLWLLRKLSTSLVIGGKRNIGCGKIKIDWDVITSSFEDTTPKKIGFVKLDETGFSTDLPFDLDAFEQKIISGEINVRDFGFDN